MTSVQSKQRSLAKPHKASQSLAKLREAAQRVHIKSCTQFIAKFKPGEASITEFVEVDLVLANARSVLAFGGPGDLGNLDSMAVPSTCNAA